MSATHAFEIGAFVVVDSRRNVAFNGRRGRVMRRSIRADRNGANGYDVGLSFDADGIDDGFGVATLFLLESEIRAVEDNGPNQRDYYPLGEDAWRRAVDEHVARLAKLRAVYDELFSIVEQLDEAAS